MNLFNINQCHSVKNKTDIYTQCCNKPKKNENFCGVHLNSKKIILYSMDNVNNTNNMENLSLMDSTISLLSMTLDKKYESLIENFIENNIEDIMILEDITSHTSHISKWTPIDTN